ncbi:MAG: hypothetical protein ACLP9S_19090 [Syntrophales bacterium]
MAELSKGRLRRRKEELKEALVGKMQEDHKFMIKVSLGHIKAIEEELSLLWNAGYRRILRDTLR